MVVIWITGVSGVGKTTLAKALAERLRLNSKVEVFDGDEIRNKLYPNLGFSKEERWLHNRVVVEMAKLLAKHGVIVIVALISPYREVREYARKEIEKVSKFLEVYINCPLEVRIKRNELYTRALKGEVKGLTGYDGVYEKPENPDVYLDSSKMTVEEEVEVVLRKLREIEF